MLAVVVVNWNDAERSVAALRSALDADGPEPLVVLVDNGSDEDPRSLLAEELPDAHLVRRSRNGGFAAGCNEGVRVALHLGADRVLLLNNDATLEPGALAALAEEHRRHPARILAPLVVLADHPGTVWSAGGTVRPPLLRNHHVGLGDRRDEHVEPRRVPWATACALHFSASTWKRVGPLDEDLFLYLEDVEWGLRARAVGVETWTVPAAVVRHEVSRTTRRLPRGEVRYYAHRNRYRVAFRHAPRWAKVVVAADLAWTLAKGGLRSVGWPSYRHDHEYHARTRACRDVLVGRWGRDPHADRPAAGVGVAR